jgi:nitroreductase
MQLDNAIKKRHSVRKYTRQLPDWRTIIECIDSVRYAPMAGNNFTLKFILVSEPEKIRKIAQAAQQDFVASARYVVVACSTPFRTINAYGEKGGVYVRQQAGASIQNFLLKIEESGLATCWIGYFAEEQVKRTLSIPEDAQVEAIFPIGYEFPKSYTKRKKIDLDMILRFNSFKNKKMKPEKKLNV